MRHIVIFGGTFNPVHKGHLEILCELDKLEGVDEIFTMPSKIPPHKVSDQLADEEFRLEMCKIAANSSHKATVCDIELNRDGKSYTINTLEKLVKLYPDTKFSLTVGGDMLVTFDQWKDYEEILKLASLICFSRGNTEKEKIQSALTFLKSKGADVTFIEKEIIDISSTDIRNNINDEDYLKQYLPLDILKLIKKNNIYGG